DRNTFASSPLTTDQRAATGVFRRLLFNRATRFWCCVAAFGTAGCVFGVSMANSHPVALTLSVLWWGFYFGCFGWCISAWIGFFTERAPIPPSEGPDAAGKLTTRVDGLGFPPSYTHHVNGAIRAASVNPTGTTTGTPDIASGVCRVLRPST